MTTTCAAPAVRHAGTGASAAFLMPFVIAVMAYTASGAWDGLPAVAAPLVAAAATLYLTCMLCAAIDPDEAGFAVAGSLGVLCAASVAMPFLVASADAAPAFWLLASDLGIVCVFAADHLATLGVCRPFGRVVASAVVVQTASVAAVFVLGTPLAVLGYALFLLAHSRALRRSFDHARLPPRAVARGDR